MRTARPSRAALYSALYMARAFRTQIYLTQEQRERIDELAEREGKTLAQVVRDAIDAYVAAPSRDSFAAILQATYGAAPDFEAPSRAEWERRYG